MVKVNDLCVYSLFQFISFSNQLIVKEYLRNTSPTMSQQIHKLNPVNIWGNVYLIIRYTFLIQQCLCLFTVWTSRNSEYSNLSIHIETIYEQTNKYTNIKKLKLLSATVNMWSIDTYKFDIETSDVLHNN